MSIFEQLVASAQQDVDRRRADVPIRDLESQLGQRTADRPFREALARSGLSVIAEFKRKSPSAGEIRADADVAARVSAYEAGGASALSVLTDLRFGGLLDDLRVARRASELPILRKDFTVDPYQLYEAAVSGADAVLLIVAALTEGQLSELHDGARTLDLDCVVEVRDLNDLELALALDADVIGINNRNLDDFDVDISTTHELMAHVPTGKTVVAESGYQTREQLEELERIGVDAVLIGETLMRSDNPEWLLRELQPDEEATREHAI